MEDTFHDAEISKTIPGEPVVFSFMAVSVCLLLLSLSITLFSTITRQRQEIDKNISALAAYVASMDNVVSMLETVIRTDLPMKSWIPCLKIFPISMS